MAEHFSPERLIARRHTRAALLDLYTSAPADVPQHVSQAHTRRASLKESTPTGRIMNSCMARLLPAWLPPLMMLNAGTGSVCAREGCQQGQRACLEGESVKDCIRGMNLGNESSAFR